MLSPRKTKPADYVEGLAKGIAILECFDASHPEMTLSEVARRVNLSAAAARRGLLTLKSLGYVGQKEKRFHLTPKIMALGSTFYFSSRIDELLQPELQAIVDRYGDAASVGTLYDHDVIYIAHASVQRARRAIAVVGARYPAFATSMGRVLLAALPEEHLDQYLDKLKPVALTPETLVDPKILRDEIDKVRQTGYATTVDQLDYGITAVAVPIRNAEGKPVAALNSSGYTGKVTPQQLIDERLPELRAAASRLSQSMARFPVLESNIAGD